MITMTDRRGLTYATDHILGAIETTLEPVRAIAAAAQLQLAPMVAAAEAVEAALYPQRLMVETIAATATQVLPTRYLQAVVPVLPAFQVWTPVAPVLAATPLIEVADHWRALIADLLRPAVRFAGEVAQWMYAALIEGAERAHAVLCTDPDVRRRQAAVEEFAVHWIGVGKQTSLRRAAILEAAEDVLLSACWRAPAANGVDLTLGSRLRSQVHREARRHRPIWENQVQGHAIDQLDRVAGRGDQDESITLAERLADPRNQYVMLEGGLDAQRRLRPVLQLLKPEHRLVVLQHAHDDGLTWQEAAVRAGLPPEAGERARRRVRRLTRELQRRRLP
ncbi:hypothetical protein [Amycolatopsis sp. cmx-4-61]|uniref:hypothetical protein n=1 Tax=Amycolatopsis sp. cmx-4-61 TaxID=2790937 RepID=UPI003979510F